MHTIQSLRVFAACALTGLVSGSVAAFAQSVVVPDFGRYERPFDDSRGVLSYADAIERIYPSVVRINYVVANQKQGVVEATGNGSGVIFDVGRGLVLTNAHVVEDASLIGIELFDGRLVEARVLGRDEVTDLAVLQADLPGTQTAVFVDSRTLRVGDVVFAVGFPRGLDRTVSMGVISGLNRQGFNEPGEEPQVEDFIQTDAAINPGNSGGPLFDSQGRVVGINTFIFRESDGLGFAVPSSVAVVVARQLAEHGVMRRGRMGVGFETLTDAKATALGVKVRSGALVTQVEPGSAADRSGLRVGDVITGAGTHVIASGEDLMNFALLADIDTPQRLFVHRGGDLLRLDMRLTPLDGMAARAAPEPPPAPAVRNDVYGAQLAPGAAQGGGAAITDVTPGSPAEDNGLTAGDVVISLNGRPVTDSAGLIAALDALAPGEIAALRIRRGDVEFLSLFNAG